MANLETKEQNIEPSIMQSIFNTIRQLDSKINCLEDEIDNMRDIIHSGAVFERPVRERNIISTEAQTQLQNMQLILSAHINTIDKLNDTIKDIQKDFKSDWTK